jgi:putative transposase
MSEKEEAELGFGDPGGEAAELGLGDPGGEEAELGLGDPRVLREDRGWYTRGYLPHFDSTHVMQFITFRLADSLPQSVLRQIEAELAHVPPTDQDRERYRQNERWLDASMGCCALRHPQVAAVMQETLRKFDPERYRLLAWCIMPNHVHVLIHPHVSLAKILQSWKSYTGRWAMARNAELGLGVPGEAFWMHEYWDRYIRDDVHLRRVVAYIHENPVKAGLCAAAEDWPWSSAWIAKP